MSTVYGLVRSGSVTSGVGGPMLQEREKGKKGKEKKGKKGREMGLKTKQRQ